MQGNSDPEQCAILANIRKAIEEGLSNPHLQTKAQMKLKLIDVGRRLRERSRAAQGPPDGQIARVIEQGLSEGQLRCIVLTPFVLVVIITDLGIGMLQRARVWQVDGCHDFTVGNRLQIGGITLFNDGDNDHSHLHLAAAFITDSHTQQMYSAMWRCVSETVGGTQHLCAVVADAERANINAIRVVLNVSVWLCHFHFQQAIRRYIDQMGLSREVAKAAHQFREQLAVIATAATEEMMNEMIAQLRGQMDVVAKQMPSFRSFARYLERQYLSGHSTFPPQMWALHLRLPIARLETEGAESVITRYTTTSLVENIWRNLSEVRRNWTDAALFVNNELLSRDTEHLLRQEGVLRRLRDRPGHQRSGERSLTLRQALQNQGQGTSSNTDAIISTVLPDELEAVVTEGFSWHFFCPSRFAHGAMQGLLRRPAQPPRPGSETRPATLQQASAELNQRGVTLVDPGTGGVNKCGPRSIAQVLRHNAEEGLLVDNVILSQALEDKTNGVDYLQTVTMTRIYMQFQLGREVDGEWYWVAAARALRVTIVVWLATCIVASGDVRFYSSLYRPHNPQRFDEFLHLYLDQQGRHYLAMGGFTENHLLTSLGRLPKTLDGLKTIARALGAPSSGNYEEVYANVMRARSKSGPNAREVLIQPSFSEPSTPPRRKRTTAARTPPRNTAQAKPTASPNDRPHQKRRTRNKKT